MFCFVCVCVSWCERKREIERGRERNRRFWDDSTMAVRDSKEVQVQGWMCKDFSVRTHTSACVSFASSVIASLSADGVDQGQAHLML